MWALFGPTIKFNFNHFIFTLIFIFTFKNTNFLCWPTSRQRNFSFSQIHKLTRAKILRGIIKGIKFWGSNFRANF